MKIHHKIIALSTVSLLAACGGTPYTANDNPTTDELLEGKKPIYSGKKNKARKAAAQQQTIIYSPYPQGPVSAPNTPLPDGVLSFEQWKQARENNTQEYRDFIEYQQYLNILNTPPEN